MIAWSLACVSVLVGFLTRWTFRRMTDRVAFRQIRKRLFAHLLEFRLFYDDPALIWRAQKAVVRENLHLLALLAPPALILTLPAVWLLIQLETVYAYAPLEVGKPTVVTAPITGELIPADPGASLHAPHGISLETPPVRRIIARQISWRIRPLHPVFVGEVAGIDCRGPLGTDEVAAIELNVSCPNVRTGLEFGAEPAELASLLERVRPLSDKPLIVKLTPNTADVAAVGAPVAPGQVDVAQRDQRAERERHRARHAEREADREQLQVPRPVERAIKEHRDVRPHCRHDEQHGENDHRPEGPHAPRHRCVPRRPRGRTSNTTASRITTTKSPSR